MSQHDMDLANGTGAAFRADATLALKALASTSAGNARPAPVYAKQMWVDQDTPSGTIWTLNMYDGADDIALFYIDSAANKARPAYAVPLDGSGGVGGAWPMTGDLLMGQNATLVPGSGNSTTGSNLSANGSLHLSNNGAYVASFNRNGTGTIAIFNISGTGVGSITVSGSSTAYNTSSDARLKTNVQSIDWREAAVLLGRLRPVWFNWISSPLGPRVDGFISQEVQAVLPHVVTGAPDATEEVTHRAVLDGDGKPVLDDDGRPRLEPLARPFRRIVPQGIDQAKLTPLLTAIVNGLVSCVRDLEERLAAIEAARGDHG